MPHGTVGGSYNALNVSVWSRANHAIFSNLMAKDDFKNLGFKEDEPSSTPKPAAEAEKGVKGELRW